MKKRKIPKRRGGIFAASNCRNKSDVWGNGFPSQLVDCRTREPGVLILSPFAGAGGMMHEALLVNPYEVDACVDNIHEA